MEFSRLEIDGRLAGLVHVSASLPGRRDSAWQRVAGPAPNLDDYARNIQTADLNALNATFAVIRWKRHLGIYADLTDETFSSYSIATNEIANEDRP